MMSASFHTPLFFDADRRMRARAGASKAEVADRLADLLIAVEELRVEFDAESANALRWAEATVEEIWTEVDALLRSVAH